MGKKSSNNNNKNNQQQQQEQEVVAVSNKQNTKNEQAEKNNKNNTNTKSHIGEQFFHPDEVAVPLVPEGMEPDQLLNELSWISRLFFALYLYALIHGFVMAYRGALG